MTPVVPCSFGSVTLLTKATFSPRKEVRLLKGDAYRRSLKVLPANKRLFVSRSVSVGLVQRYCGNCSSKHSSKIQVLAAVGTDVATEEPNPAVKEEFAEEIPENSPASTGSDDKQPSFPSVASTVQSKRLRPTKKSDMPVVKNEELVAGASFTGKVRSIQPFGAFVDIGSFTDGLVHVSKLSEGFVKDVASVVSVGQEVKVRIVEVNMESGRISLTMRDDSTIKLQQKKDSSNSENERPRTARKNVGGSKQKRDEARKSSKFVKGQVLDGTVKNLARSGAYVSLPDGEEGFLPLEEESEGFGNILGSSSLQVGQEINVRVLRISRGQATLTMKKEEDVEAINKQLNQGVVHTATNPFMLAFRKNKDIATFLEEREKAQRPEVVSSQQLKEGDNETLIDEADTLALEDSIIGDENVENTLLDSLQNEDLLTESLHRDEEGAETSISEGSVSSDDSVVAKASEEYGTKEPESSIEASDDGVGEDNSSKVVVSPDTGSSIDACVPETVVAEVQEIEPQVESVAVDDDTTSETLVSQETDSVVTPVESVAVDFHTTSETQVSQETDSIGVFDTDTNSVKAGGSVDDSAIVGTSSTDILKTYISQTEPIPDNGVSTTSTQATNFEVLEPVLTTEIVANEESNISNDQNLATASISPTLVQKLREETGAGMMDCKKALAETEGDIVKAQEFLRKKGLASADKKASRATAEGRIGSYIHDNRIGVLIEVNCETDFVARGDIFKELVDDLAMQVAACPQVSYLVTEDVPEETVAKEKEIERQREDLLKKPEQIREKIVEGRIRKRLEEFALLEQPYIKNDKVVVKDWVKQTIATIGENIKVKRFVRYNLGEGLEKKSQDFASEVAAQTAAKATPVVPKDQPKKAEDDGEKPPSVVVSAALVKQLREETGAGMMDCKKALAETGGDLEMAQEYLRKKGLSSADKKSSRLAAEGRISSYIHDSRIGVLIEVNCETDFVARNEKFKELVDDLAMQVVACPQAAFVSVDEIPESITSHEKEIELQREDLKSKPENIRERIVEGRVSKRLGELALLEQPFIKDDSVLVKDFVKQTIAALGENIRIRRFVKFNLGE